MALASSIVTPLAGRGLGRSQVISFRKLFRLRSSGDAHPGTTKTPCPSNSEAVLFGKKTTGLFSGSSPRYPVTRLEEYGVTLICCFASRRFIFFNLVPIDVARNFISAGRIYLDGSVNQIGHIFLQYPKTFPSGAPDAPLIPHKFEPVFDRIDLLNCTIWTGRRPFLITT